MLKLGKIFRGTAAAMFAYGFGCAMAEFKPYMILLFFGLAVLTLSFDDWSTSRA